jgi:hypothetical protein
VLASLDVVLARSLASYENHRRQAEAAYRPMVDRMHGPQAVLSAAARQLIQAMLEESILTATGEGLEILADRETARRRRETCRLIVKLCNPTTPAPRWRALAEDIVSRDDWRGPPGRKKSVRDARTEAWLEVAREAHAPRHRPSRWTRSRRARSRSRSRRAPCATAPSSAGPELCSRGTRPRWAATWPGRRSLICGTPGRTTTPPVPLRAPCGARVHEESPVRGPGSGHGACAVAAWVETPPASPCSLPSPPPAMRDRWRSRRAAARLRPPGWSPAATGRSSSPCRAGHSGSIPRRGRSSGPTRFPHRTTMSG